MFWLGIVVIMTLAQSKQLWNAWGFRITVISSLVANLVVGIMSGTRRRSVPPGWWWGFLGLAAQFSLWGAYQLAEVAATSAIGSLSLCGTDASEEEQQVAAFWGTFLLLHLGGPDNLTAYALEDNKISERIWIELVFQIGGMVYTVFDNTHRGARSWALLLAASVVMLLAGGVRYFERAKARGKANFDSMQEDAASSSSSSGSSKDDDDEQMDHSLKCTRMEAGNASSSSSTSSCSKDDAKMAYLKFRIEKMKRQGRLLGDREALLLAQDLFPVWRHALVDSSVDPNSQRQKASEAILTTSSSESDGPAGWDWESRCKVAEMELSLIYEFLYTKAILAHSWTWRYYLTPLLSPLSTAAAAFLFSLWLLHPADNGGRRVVRGSFVGITYALLTVTFLTDVAWLLRALGSTWAYAYVREHAGEAGARRWWCSLHRIVVCLDPLHLLFGRDPVSQRRWSGTIGRYNLLHECSAAPSHFRPEWWPVSKAGDEKPKEMRYRCKLPRCVKRALFERVTEILQEAIRRDKNKNKNLYTREDTRTRWGHKAFRSAGDGVKRKIKSRMPKKRPPPSDEDAEATMFGTEFEEDVLLWHIATCMLVSHFSTHISTWAAIEVMSEYMMFLVAVRRQMLPGLVLHSQLLVIRRTLKEVWAEGKDQRGFKGTDKEKLALLLRFVTDKPARGRVVIPIEATEATQLLYNAVSLYFVLSGDEKEAAEPQPKLDDDNDGNMLKFIFNVWVDKLVYAAVRCSREAHATQLSAGGDLTTVLWMLIQHAGPFCIGEFKTIYLSLPDEKKESEEKKKKEEEEKKKKPARPPPQGAPTPPCIPCPVCPPCYHPSYPPVCPPCYNPSCPHVCPWCSQCPPQHERPAREDGEQEDSSSDEDSSEE